jgi:hypothetical protein
MLLFYENLKNTETVPMNHEKQNERFKNEIEAVFLR